MDMAQSMTSRGRIRIAMDTGQETPENWAIDGLEIVVGPDPRTPELRT
jgi:hypothetical protein